MDGRCEHDLVKPYLRQQIAEAFRREHQASKLQLVEVFGRLLLQLDVGVAVLRDTKQA